MTAFTAPTQSSFCSTSYFSQCFHVMLIKAWHAGRLWWEERQMYLLSAVTGPQRENHAAGN